MIHLALHCLVPLLTATLFFRKQWRKAFMIMMITMLVDIDHLLATPIYDVNRCSIGFHPLHQWLPIILYFAACFHRKTRLIGIGLIIHMTLDGIDCYKSAIGDLFFQT